jgi:hypothetical protein
MTAEDFITVSEVAAELPAAGVFLFSPLAPSPYPDQDIRKSIAVA